MKTEVLAVQSELERTEGQTKKCQLPGHRYWDRISKYFWCGVMIVGLSPALAMPANAQLAGIGASGNAIFWVGGAVVAVTVAVVTVVVIHYSKKRTITGCVNPGVNGLTVTDEKNERIYALSGDTTGIKPGDRMKLKGKKVKSKGSHKTPVWEIRGLAKDFGVCPP
jgi:hypothetical protein